jgi:hypothetical protein
MWQESALDHNKRQRAAKPAVSLFPDFLLFFVLISGRPQGFHAILFLNVSIVSILSCMLCEPVFGSAGSVQG